MTKDYDLVVIGNSLEGIYAAMTAANLKARVALIAQTGESFASIGNYAGICEAIYQRSLSELGNLSQRLAQVRQLGIYPGSSLEMDLSQVKSWLDRVHATVIEEQFSPVQLAALGIDVVEGRGEFHRLPQLELVVGKRQLRSRSYLIATGSSPQIPSIPGLTEIGYLTSRDLWQQDKLVFLPSALAIVGNSLNSLELAENLARLGKNITLILENSRILPSEDIDSVNLIQAQLEAEGIRILPQSSVIQVRRIETKKWLQAGDRAIEVDEIILSTAQQANVAGLNLEGVGVEVGNQGIQVNRKLQTTHPHIYACGSAIGGYPLPSLAQYEASIAVKNALFYPLWQVNYDTIPYVIGTHPALARVGMTERQARRQYGEEVIVTKQYFKTITRSHISGETTGFCKLILRHNGEILGAHLVGAEVGELIGSIALAMKNQLKISAIAHLFYPGLTLSEILQKSAIAWENDRLKRYKNWQNLLETWLIWQRR